MNDPKINIFNKKKQTLSPFVRMFGVFMHRCSPASPQHSVPPRPRGKLTKERNTEVSGTFP